MQPRSPAIIALLVLLGACAGPTASHEVEKAIARADYRAVLAVLDQTSEADLRSWPADPAPLRALTERVLRSLRD